MKKVILALLLLAACAGYARASCDEVVLWTDRATTGESPKCDVDDARTSGIDVDATGPVSIQLRCYATATGVPKTLSMTGVPLEGSGLVVVDGLYPCKFLSLNMTLCTGCTVDATCRRCRGETK